MTESETLICVPLLVHTLQLFAMQKKNLDYSCLLFKFDSVHGTSTRILKSVQSLSLSSANILLFDAAIVNTKVLFFSLPEINQQYFLLLDQVGARLTICCDSAF